MQGAADQLGDLVRRNSLQVSVRGAAANFLRGVAHAPPSPLDHGPNPSSAPSPASVPVCAGTSTFTSPSTGPSRSASAWSYAWFCGVLSEKKNGAPLIFPSD